MNFNYIDKFNVNRIKKIVSSFSDEWEYDSYRQNTFDAHSSTKTYNIYNVNIFFWKPGMPYQTELTCKNLKLLKCVDKIVAKLERLHDGKVGQCLLTNLPAGKEIPLHMDKGSYLVVSKRHHIPIITNENVFFFVDGEFNILQEGECWEIDNKKSHRVVNAGICDRVHLVIDIIPNKDIGKHN